MTQLFKQELQLYEKQEMHETGEGSQKFSDIINKILEILSSLNAYSIGCLEKYLEKAKQAVVLNKQKLKADAPNVVDSLKHQAAYFSESE